MTCQVSSGLWHGFLQASSRVRLLSDTDNIVRDFKRWNLEVDFSKFFVSYIFLLNIVAFVDVFVELGDTRSELLGNMVVYRYGAICPLSF